MKVRLLILLLTELLQERSLVRSLVELLLEWLQGRLLPWGEEIPPRCVRLCLLGRQCHPQRPRRAVTS